MNLWRKTPRYLRLAALALVLGFLILGADAVLNPPLDWDKVTEWGNSHPTEFATVDSEWTFLSSIGTCGFICTTWKPTNTRWTSLKLGSFQHGVNCSPYAVIGSGHCFLFTGTFMVLWLIKRKHPPAV